VAGGACGGAGTPLGVSPRPTLARRVVAEAVGTALLLAAVVGSGIMGERLAAGNVAIALLANTMATGAALVALILTFGPISGAHFNPAVTLADAFQGGLRWPDVPAYVVAQVIGAFVGGFLAGVFHINVQIIGHPIISEMIVAFVGAVLLLLIVRLFRPMGARRRAYWT